MLETPGEDLFRDAVLQLHPQDPHLRVLWYILNSNFLLFFVGGELRELPEDSYRETFSINVHVLLVFQVYAINTKGVRCLIRQTSNHLIIKTPRFLPSADHIDLKTSQNPAWKELGEISTNSC